jgi:hypothetical protein
MTDQKKKTWSAQREAYSFFHFHSGQNEDWIHEDFIRFAILTRSSLDIFSDRI